MMAGDDLRQLERDVEAARAKLTSDIAALRGPGAFSGLAENLKQAAMDTRDTFIDDAKARTRSALDEMLETVKEKAVANPAAALVIGAGIAWHLVRRPPVAAALIGGGLYSLLRTNGAQHRSGGSTDALVRARRNLKDQAEGLAATAGSLGRQAAEAARIRAGELAEASRDKVAELRETGEDKIEELREAVRKTAARAPLVGSQQRLVPAGPDPEDEMPEEEPVGMGRARTRALSTDGLLLGVAGIAVAAAVATAYRRRANPAK